MTTKVQFIIEAIDDASQKLKDVTKGLDGMGAQSKISKTDVALAGAAISGSIIKIGTDAVQTFMGFEKTMSGVSAVLTPTKQDFTELSTLARKLGKDTTYSAQEAAGMMEMLAKNGINARQILDGAADASLNLAAATGAQLSQAADIASSAMTVFGKTTAELEQVVNSITGTTNVSKFGIEDYAQAMAQGGGAAATFGVSLEDFNASIAATSSLFQSGSDAGTSFKTFLISLAPSTTASFNAMQKLGIVTADNTKIMKLFAENGIKPADDSSEAMADSMEELRKKLKLNGKEFMEFTQDTGALHNSLFTAEGKMKSMAEVSDILRNATKDLSDEQRINTFHTIFGTDAMRAAAGMTKMTAEEFEKMSKAIEGTDAAENARVRLDNLDGAMKQLGGSIEAIQLSLGSMLTPAIRGAAETLSYMADIISSVMTWIQALPGPVATAIEVFVGLAIAGVTLTAMWAAMTVTMGGVAIAMWNIITPTLPIIAAVAAVAAGLYLLYQAGKVVIDFLVTAWNGNLAGVRDFTLGVWAAIQSAFTSSMEFIKSVASAGLDFLSYLWEDRVGIIQRIWEGFWNVALFPLELAIQAITVAVVAFYQLFTGDWDGFLNTISTAWSNSWNAILSTGKVIWDSLKAAATIVFTAFGSFLGTLWETVKTTFVTKWTTFKEAAIQIWKDLTGWFSGEGSKSFADAFSGMFNTVAAAAKSIFNNIISIMEGFLNTAIDGINRLIAASNKVNPVGQIGMVPTIQLARYAHGGIVQGPGGLDNIPAMLTAGEVVLNAAQQGNVASAIKGGSGNGSGLTIIVQGNYFYGDDDSFAEKIGDKVLDIFKNHTAIQSF